jgi:hypothetical protein
MIRWRRYLLSTAATMLALGMPGCAHPGASPRAATSQEWQDVQIADGITAELPPGLQRIAARGIDSEVTEYRSPALAVVFDCGEHGGVPDEPGWRQEQILVGGRTATLVSGHYPGRPDHPFGAVVHFPNMGSLPAAGTGAGVSGRSLTVTARCRTEQDCLTARRIVESIRFPR